MAESVGRKPHRNAVSLERALSKLGYCSRAQARPLITAGRVSVNGRVDRLPSARVDPARDRIAVDGTLVRPAQHVYIALNKPRGLVTSAADERGRATVYSCFEGADLPHIGPVGRLDRDSEGLLLFTNDTRWADQLLAPTEHVDKTYRVLVEGRASDDQLLAMKKGVKSKRGDVLSAKAVHIIERAGGTTWLEVVIDEGRNRHIRRMLEALDLPVLRLIRIAIGKLQLGELAKGHWRPLTQAEVDSFLRPPVIERRPAMHRQTSGDNRERRVRSKDARKEGKLPSETHATTGSQIQRREVRDKAPHSEKLEAKNKGKLKSTLKGKNQPRPGAR